MNSSPINPEQPSFFVGSCLDALVGGGHGKVDTPRPGRWRMGSRDLSEFSNVSPQR